MDLETYKKTFSENDMPGWDAITGRLSEIYPGRDPDFKIATLQGWRIGGPSPLDLVCIYKRTDPIPHLHFISYGMSELYYDEESAGNEFGKWGFEFTFRFAVGADEMPSTDADIPMWAVHLMQNLGRYVYDSEKWFEHGHVIRIDGEVREDMDSLITAAAFALDPEMGAIDTPHGKVDFLQIVGITEDEIAGAYDGKYSGAELREALSKENPFLITDFGRRHNVI